MVVVASKYGQKLDQAGLSNTKYMSKVDFLNITEKD